MTRPYGKMPPGQKKPTTTPPPTEIQVNITGRHTMEQLALEVQRALAMVEEFGAFGLEKFRFRLLPIDHEGKPIVLRDEAGHAVTVINIPAEASPPIYRENEPGVGVSPMSGPPSHANPSTSAARAAKR